MLVAKDPQLGKVDESQTITVEPARVDPDLKSLKDLLFNTGNFDLALGRLFEGSIESCAKVVGVEA